MITNWEWLDRQSPELRKAIREADGDAYWDAICWRTVGRMTEPQIIAALKRRKCKLSADLPK